MSATPRPAPTQTADGDVFEVFARFGADEPLHHVGSVVAPDGELAGWYAHTLYNEWAWHEMVVVARRGLVALRGPAPAGGTQTYHIYGRKAHTQPLTFLVRLDVAAGADLHAAALARVGPAGWVELVAIPGAALVPVIPEAVERGA